MSPGDLVEFIACPFQEIKLTGVVQSYMNSWATVLTINDETRQEHYFEVHKNDILKVIQGYLIR